MWWHFHFPLSLLLLSPPLRFHSEWVIHMFILIFTLSKCVRTHIYLVFIQASLWATWTPWMLCFAFHSTYLYKMVFHLCLSFDSIDIFFHLCVVYLHTDLNLMKQSFLFLFRLIVISRTRFTLGISTRLIIAKSYIKTFYVASFENKRRLHLHSPGRNVSPFAFACFSFAPVL